MIPGEYPFTRGVYPTMYRSALWTMRQYSGQSTPDSTNERFKYLLKNGQTGLSLAFDLPTQIGLDSDMPLAEDDVGKLGVAVDSLEDFERIFDGIALDQISTSFTINATAPIILAMYVLVGKKQGVEPKQAAGDDPERHPEGVHRPGDLDLPAGTVDQTGGRPGGVLQQGDPAVQRDQRLGNAYHGVRGQYDAVGRPGDLDRGGLYPGGPETGIAHRPDRPAVLVPSADRRA